MAIGLTNRKNLSEKNLNLKNALQKLYAPGIESDLELFSLSSSLESLVISGPLSDETSQITGIATEQLQEVSGSVIRRTKFTTKFFTYTDGNEVYFSKYTLGTGGGSDVTPIKYPDNGSIPALELIAGGGGFYITDNLNQVIIPDPVSPLILENVPLRGETSGATNARATVTFVPRLLEGVIGTYSNSAEASLVTINLSAHGFAQGDFVYIRVTSGTALSALLEVTEVVNENQFVVTAAAPITAANTSAGCVVTNGDDLARFTPTFPTRYTISSVQITETGSGYIVPEALRLVEGTVRLQSEGTNVRLIKQKSALFSGQPEIIRTKQFSYVVKGASSEGFFLYDNVENKYLFLDRTTPNPELTPLESESIVIRRFDGVNTQNILQFKYSQSPIYLRGYNFAFGIGGGSVSGVINNVASATNSLRLRMEAAIQNTRRPTPPDSSENILGYRYNSFIGQDVVIWQRVVLRDQDFTLAPSVSVTGDQLRSNVTNFQLNSTGEKVPGLFIRVGNQYFRAFSTTDKPFFRDGGLNPQLGAGGNQYSLSAEDTNDGGLNWYAYNTQISELAQRLHPNGRDGAFYYHRSTAPVVRNVPTNIGNIYAVPLFTQV
jgi:hypothetical protein